MLKAVIFDIDDTLFDHRHSARTALTTLQEHYPTELGAVPMDELERAHRELLNTIHIQVLNGTLDQSEARRRRFALLLTRYGIEASEEEQLALRRRYRACYQASRRAAIGSIPLLMALRERELRIGLLSNNLVEEQLGKLDACGLRDLVDSMTISEEAGVTKPDLRIFHIALERLGCSASEVVLIGDSWTNDIQPARTLGIHSIWYNSYAAPIRDETVPILTSFLDLDLVLAMVLGSGATLWNSRN